MNAGLALDDSFGATHIRTQHLRNRDAAVLVLVVLHYRDQGPRKSETRAVEGMRQLRLTTFLAKPNLRATRLKVRAIRTRRDLQPLRDAWRPHLDVVLSRRGKSQVSGTHLNDAERNLQAPANLARILD